MQYSIVIHAEGINEHSGPFYRIDELQLRSKQNKKFNLFINNDSENTPETIFSNLYLIPFLSEEDLNLFQRDDNKLIALQMLPNLYAILADNDYSSIICNKLISKTSSSNLIHEKIQIHSIFFELPKSKAIVMLPTCPVCISRIEKAVTGLNTIKCRDLFHSCCQNKHQITSLGCETCQVLFNFKTRGSEMCSDCGSAENVWICLICANFGCGRYKGGHAHNHFIKSGHAFSLKLNSHRIWNYSTDRYVHWKIVSAEGAVEVTEEAFDSKDNNVNINNVSSILEGTFLNDFTTAQLESQKEYFDERLRAIQKSYHLELSKLNETHNEQIIKLNSELNNFNNEHKVLIELKAQLQDTNKKLKQKSHSLVDELETERKISHGLAKTIDDLQCQLNSSKAEQKDLEDQVKDLMKHIEILDLMAKAGNDPNIVEGKLLIRPPSGGNNKNVNKKKIK